MFGKKKVDLQLILSFSVCQKVHIYYLSFCFSLTKNPNIYSLIELLACLRRTMTEESKCSGITSATHLFSLVFFLFKCTNPMNDHMILSKQFNCDILLKVGLISECVCVCSSEWCTTIQLTWFGLCFVALNLQYLKLRFLSRNDISKL